MSEQPTMQVRNRPKPPTFTSVPEGLKSFMHSRGKRLSWQRDSTDHLSLVQGMHIEPVNLKAVVEELEASESEADKQLLDEVKRARPYLTPEGYFKRADAVLCAQPQDVHEDYEAFFAERGRERSGNVEAEMAALEDEMQRTIREETGKPAKGPLLTGNIPSVRDVVHVSKRLRTPNVRVGSDED